MDEAIKIVCAKNFHQSLWLPATPDHERLRVTFSTTSNFDDDSLPVFLFCGPMFGSRYNTLDFDYFFRQNRVRVICVDRPSMGGSTPVDINIRVKVWLETVPLLLQKLNVKHVHLLSHSAGTIYVLNTLYHHRNILYPDRPYIAMIAPWVHTSHSNATLMNIVSKIPISMFGNWSNITKFVAGRIMPATAWSGGALSWSGGALTAVGNIFQTSSATENVAQDDVELTPEETYGVPHEIAQHIEKLRMKYCLTESWAAGNEDAMLCLKKSGVGSWGICEDYAEYVQSLVKLEQSRRSTETAAAKLSMRVYFAESDVMIGKEGKAYFKQCWAQDGVQDVIDLRFHDLPGTNHDSSIIDVRKGGLKPIFQEVTECA